MNTVTTTFTLPASIAQGLATGAYERVGGVIREAGTKRVVSWLRETGTSNLPGLPSLLGFSGLPLPSDPVTGALNLVVQSLNTGVLLKGFGDVKTRLSALGKQIEAVERSVQEVKGVLQVTSAVSALNLGVSVMGFAVINQRLNELEKRLAKTEELLNKIDKKIDLAHYANFKAALGLAINAFTMSKRENRDNMATQAINRFLEAEHIYSDYAGKELKQGSRLADEYLLTLSLAYMAEVRCHLELNEIDTALSRLQEAERVIGSLTKKYIELLLTSNPAAYLQPQFKGQIDLRRLTQIHQWIDSTLDENAVFEMHRENLVNLSQDPGKWIESLPAAIWDAQVDWVGKAFWDDPKPQIFSRLPRVMAAMESMIETHRRLESYQWELQAIAQLGISFHEWLQLTPSEPKPDDAKLVYVIPSEPISAT
jgi:tetratricopeptide (TPR) repeat protein